MAGNVILGESMNMERSALERESLRTDQRKSKSELIFELRQVRREMAQLKSRQQHLFRFSEYLRELLRKGPLGCFLNTTLNGILAHIALLDAEGTIVLVNGAWRNFARENGARPEDVSKGCNYFTVCSRAHGEHAEKAHAFAEGLRRVMYGERESYALEYPCPSPEKERWFLGMVAPLSGTIPRGVVVSHWDITEHKLLEEQLREMSLRDSLTGLYNRAFFEAELERLSANDCVPVGIIVCDIDGLKLVNDTLGLERGDELIKATAVIIRDNLRDSDIVTRTGGDEFTVLLPECSEELVRESCEGIQRGVERYSERYSDLGFSVSLGYAVKNEPPVDMRRLFKLAEDIMYKDKLQQDLSSRNTTVQALIRTLQARDYITEGHAQRLNDYAQLLGRALGLSAERLNDLQLLAQFHDLGKVGVPDRILFKPDRLTEEEFREMQRHSEIGHRITRSLTDLGPIADFILKHHEHWDGSGYPLGLAGEAIPLESRILAIVDAFDTMTSDRPYKKAVSREEALRELQRCAGTQFDPGLVDKAVGILQAEG